MKLCKLSEIAHISSGQSAPQDKNAFSESGIPFIRAGSLEFLVRGEPETHCEKVTEESAKKHRLKLFPANTILFAKSGMSAKLGRVYRLKEPAYVVSHLATVIPSNEVDPSYLQRWFERFPPSRLIPNDAYPSIRVSAIEELGINLPTLEEQKRIAAILDKADAIRRKRKQAIELTETLLQSVFLHMFGDPVTNPLGWEKVKMGGVCDVGSSKRVFVNEFVESGVPFYRGTEVGNLGEGGKIQPHLFISHQHYTSLKEKAGVPQIGDLLLPSICHDGRIWRVPNNDPFYFKDGRVLWIKTDSKKVNSEYLKIHLKAVFRANYSSIASGTTFAELKIVSLKGIQILYPPLELQNQFAERVQVIEGHKQQAQASLQKSEALFNALVQKAFRGELIQEPEELKAMVA